MNNRLHSKDFHSLGFLKYMISEDETPNSIDYIEILKIKPLLNSLSLTKNFKSSLIDVKQDITISNSNSINDKKENNTNTDYQSLASETIALIYERQGAITQAIKIYQRLIELKPEKKEYYHNKIKDLEKN